MGNIYEIIGNLLAAFVVGLLACLVPKARAWFETRITKDTQERIHQLVVSFTRAAEQLYHDTDPDGEKRRKFVMDQLRLLGVEITEAVLNMIEGSVWEINTETKKAQVQTKEIVSDGLDVSSLAEAVTQEVIARLPGQWQVRYKNLTFQVKPMNFKHTGLFPEQAVNWAFAQEQIRSAGREVSVLNLFAYTGAASVACAVAGARVCHVDAARGMVNWARENAKASGLEDAPIRWIVDDCAKFVEREIRRGRRYDAIIMDPPSYGRGPTGEVWKLEESLYPFVELVSGVLSDDPLFLILNSYTTGLAPSVVTYILETLVSKRFGGHTVSDELGLPVTESGLALPCGATGRWTRD